MNKKSFTFGLGFGIIVLSIIFYAINHFDNKSLIESYSKEDEVVELSDDDIIQLAIGIGMLTQDDLDKALNSVEPTIETVIVEQELTDDQVIEKAYELGMIFDDVEIDSNEEVLDEQEKEKELQEEEGYSQFTSVKIDSGMSAGVIAKLLNQKGVVDNTNTFQDFLINRGVTKILNAGTFVFPMGASYDDALDVLRRRKKY